jgi:1-aminocyclopropane-1-carboxylate deaminase/D-cysteine desulfhydrase-like pyridoxal-dependent ACC family enzyme
MMSHIAVDQPETPLEALSGVARHLGFADGALLVKRDDLLALAGGGNKVRKGLITVALARSAGADTLVTTGAPQSNHVRAVAALGARAGLAVHLVLDGAAPDRAVGNVLLDAVFGATVTWAGDEDLDHVADAVVEGLEAEGAVVHRVPFGGSEPATVSAYRTVGAGLAAAVPGLRHVVTAVGSGATMAGLVVALGAERVLGVDCGAVGAPIDVVAGLVRDATGQPFDQDTLRVDRRQVGTGYEHVQPPVAAAIRLAARTDAVLFDPVYSGRALTGLIAAVEEGSVGRDEPTVLLHSGGLPGLFGHPEAGQLIA